MKLDKKKVKEALRASVKKTFSDMAFLDVIEIPDFKDKVKYSYIIFITFNKPRPGGIALYLPLNCKKMIVENVYGQDWKNLKINEVDDCLLELINILTGNFLSSFFGRGTFHNVSLPQLLFDDTELNINKKFIDGYFDAEGHAFKVSVYING